MLHATYAKLRYSTFIDFAICQADWRRLTTSFFLSFHFFFAFGLTLDCSQFLCLSLPLRIECVRIRCKSIRILIWFWWNILWLSREMNTSLMAMFGTFRFDQQFIWRIWGLSIAVVFETQKCVRLSILLRSLSFPILFDKNNKRWHFGKIQPSMVGEQSDRQSEKIWSFFFSTLRYIFVHRIHKFTFNTWFFFFIKISHLLIFEVVLISIELNIFSGI